MEHELSPIVRRWGELHFERVMEVLTTRCHMTDSFPPGGRAVLRPDGHQPGQSGRFRCPVQGADVRTAQYRHAHVQGHRSRRSVRLLHDCAVHTDVIEYQEMNALLMEMNRKEREQGH